MLTFTRAAMAIAIVSVIAVAGTVAVPVSIHTAAAQQQQMNFIATLTGKDAVPPVQTSATGTAKFHINSDGSLCYEVYANNINGVIGAHIGTKNQTSIGLVDLINPYAVVSTQQVYPTATVNGLLTSGDIKVGLRSNASLGVYTYGGLNGPLIDKPVTALDNVIKSKNAYVIVRTLGHQKGEIAGQIVPTNQPVSCLTTARFGVPTTTPNSANLLY